MSLWSNNVFSFRFTSWATHRLGWTIGRAARPCWTSVTTPNTCSWSGCIRTSFAVSSSATGTRTLFAWSITITVGGRTSLSVPSCVSQYERRSPPTDRCAASNVVQPFAICGSPSGSTLSFLSLSLPRAYMYDFYIRTYLLSIALDSISCCRWIR